MTHARGLEAPRRELQRKEVSVAHNPPRALFFLLRDDVHEVDGALFVDLELRQTIPVGQDGAVKEQALCSGFETLFVVNFGLDVGNGVGALDVQRHGLAHRGAHEELHCRPAALLI